LGILRLDARTSALYSRRGQRVLHFCKAFSGEEQLLGVGWAMENAEIATVRPPG